MTEERKWVWCAGILLGLGECAFQYSHDEIRRVTKLVPNGDGIGLIKTLMGGIMKGFEVIPAEGLVVYFANVNEDFAKSCDQFWGSIIMQPANGRLRLDK
jgi:hypothetical protein